MTKDSAKESNPSRVDPGHRRLRPSSSLPIVLGSLVLCCSCICVVQKADLVLLTKDPGAVQDCRFIADVESSADYRTAAAYGELRKQAAEHGASTVLMVGRPSGSELDHVKGEAYSCPSGGWQGSKPPAAGR